MRDQTTETAPDITLPPQLVELPEEVARLLTAVGYVAWASARVDESLRNLFCGLEGSKYSAVTAGGQSTTWLSKNCAALAKLRDDVSESDTQALREIFAALKVEVERRNFYVHSAWKITEPGSPGYFGRSRFGHYQDSVQIASVQQVVETGQKLLACRYQIDEWMTRSKIDTTLGSQMMWDYFWNQPVDEDDL